MTVFNILLMKALIIDAKKATDANSIKAMQRKRRLSLTLIALSVLFVVMTLPATLAFGYFSDIMFSSQLNILIAHLLDALAFLNHASVFITCFITNVKFRNTVISFFTRGTADDRRNLSHTNGNRITTVNGNTKV